MNTIPSVHPIPCAHCGVNFMRTNLDPDALKLCNNCLLRHQKKDDQKMQKTQKDEVDILIKIPRAVQIEVEEICINKGFSFSDYFITLHGVNMRVDTIIESSKENIYAKNSEDKRVDLSLKNKAKAQKK